MRLPSYATCWKMSTFVQLIRLVMSILPIQHKVLAAEPSFRVPEINITVVQGETAVLPCSIQYLGENQVVWTDADGFILTHNEKRVIDNVRLSVERPFLKDWNLHIRETQYSDKGKYHCQINTSPPKQKDIILIVLVPPLIIRELSSRSKTIVREGNTVTLTCNATGVPQPDVTWYRLGSEPMQGRERIGSVGETLKIHNVSRDCGGTYVCEADNKNEPIAFHNMVIDVQYSPEVYLPVARMGQYLKKETFLQCEVTAHPHGLMHWAKGDYIINTGDATGKYTVEMYQSDYNEKNILSLRIREITHEDYGKYTCFAKNFIGEDKESMLLYDYSTTTVPPDYILPTRETPVTYTPDNNGNDGFNVINNNNGFEGHNQYGGENAGAVIGNSSNNFRTNLMSTATLASSLFVFFKYIGITS